VGSVCRGSTLRCGAQGRCEEQTLPSLLSKKDESASTEKSSGRRRPRTGCFAKRKRNFQLLRIPTRAKAQQIPPAIADNARRISEKEHIKKICDEIVFEIRRSRFLVADFTGSEAASITRPGSRQDWGFRRDNEEEKLTSTCGSTIASSGRI
jgi:hypothetical protein